MGLFQQNIDSGNLQIASTNSRSNRTDNLRTWKTVPNYYRSVYQDIKEGSDKALNTIKKLSDNSYQLKIQMGKFAHPLVKVDGTSYPVATFQSKKEAVEQFDAWITDLEKEEPEVVDCVEPVWKKYCSKNNIPTGEDS